MAKAFRYHELGGPEVLRLEEITFEDPAPGELRLKVGAIELNRTPKPMDVHAHIMPPAPQLSLGELIEVVAFLVPEPEVAETVAALFDRGIASFARLLSRDERTALRKV
jgi:hypothetical protein